ncbi:MAG: coproporphyrinogen III oxidase family protein [Bacteroidales bacterium]|nr:coproporphyrinogen III oxidase family protein [Bacteroidales bacterium]
MIYVHVPFCRSFCTYCDFYSEVCGKEAATFEQYADDICAEIRARRDEIAATAGVRTLYIGGGTPSVLPLQCLRKIVECLESVGPRPRAPYDEFTVEVNPEDIVERGADYVRDLLALGVNRISMGVQSLDDGMLRWMNRRHSADGARDAWRIISEVGQGKPFAPGQHRQLDRSVDLISGVPGMDLAMLEKTVDEVLEWRPEHISAYQLSVEDGSALAGMIARGQVAELPDEDCRAQYDLLCRKLAAAGYHHYEISNWALPGHEAVHNSAYWTRQPYIGLGPGAHSLEILPRQKRPKTSGPLKKNLGGPSKSAENDGAPGPEQQIRKWNSKRTTGWAEEGREVLSPEEIREETVMLLARTDRGPIPESDWFVADDLIADLL